MQNEKIKEFLKVQKEHRKNFIASWKLCGLYKKNKDFIKEYLKNHRKLTIKYIKDNF